MCFKKIGFGSKFIRWTKILIKSQESFVINECKTTPYFKLERGARQGDPISAYFFILALEVIFALINANPNIEDLEFFSRNFSYFAYADDITFFVRNEKSALELVNTFDTFSLFSGVKINK